MKTCTNCQKRQKTSNYYKDNRHKDGLYSWCKTCHGARNLQWKRERPGYYYKEGRQRNAEKRLRAIAYKGGSCVDCGYDKNPDAFEFDHHIEPRSGRRSLLAYGRKWETIQAELDKCELVCGNCHNIRTARRRREASND